MVNAQTAPDGGYDLLAVVQTAGIAQTGLLHLKSTEGPGLSLEPLPYPLS